MSVLHMDSKLPSEARTDKHGQTRMSVLLNANAYNNMETRVSSVKYPEARGFNDRPI